MSEQLTHKMLEFVNEKHLCPACLTGKLLEGPHGGCCINVRCKRCGDEFNLAFHNSFVIMGHTIDRNEAALYSKLLVWPVPPEQLAEIATAPDPRAGVGVSVDDLGQFVIHVRGSMAEDEVREVPLVDILQLGQIAPDRLDAVIGAMAAALMQFLDKRNEFRMKQN